MRDGDAGWAVEQAIYEYEDTDVNIDAKDEGDFSWADDAVWVRAWVRVAFPDACEEET